MNKADLKELTDSIVDLYITLRIRPQDEVSPCKRSKHNTFRFRTSPSKSLKPSGINSAKFNRSSWSLTSLNPLTSSSTWKMKRRTHQSTTVSYLTGRRPHSGRFLSALTTWSCNRWKKLSKRWTLAHANSKPTTRTYTSVWSRSLSLTFVDTSK